ncbi:TetR/AcrR family transcriptional regulator [Intrasporangium sp.]|uniref:TetR/AcrR family transcriptional regulator n=1 Tax=Intrasporangium sp. TaxID=1925024 RepID=UPI0029397410|nr:WHG domain-containing protein [Intrasporangium sp.]MDV3220794.1 WHG domain-containing protein [Intrasporangium sp.]
MPTPARTSRTEIVNAARSIVEASGVDGLTMQRVATTVGVKAPSLYKHVRNRDALVRLVVEDVARELTTTLDAAVGSGEPTADLRSLAEALRAFAHANPGVYGLLFAQVPTDARPDRDQLARTSAAVLRTTTALAGPDLALEAARTVVAWAHGFISMELAGAFRLGGDLDRAYAFGIERLGAALVQATPGPAE